MSITEKTMVYTLTIDHKHGVNTSVHRTEEGALARLASYAREWFGTESARWENDPDAPTRAAFAAMPDGDAIETYFHLLAEHGGEEFYSLDSTELED